MTSEDAPTMDDCTVSEIRDEVSEIDDPDLLAELLEEEENGKDRKTAKEAIKDRFKAVDADADAEDEAEADAEAEDDDDDDTSHSPMTVNPFGEFVRVKPPEGGGHIAGYSFAPGEVKEVKHEAKVKRALSKGQLQIVR